MTVTKSSEWEISAISIQSLSCYPAPSSSVSARSILRRQAWLGLAARVDVVVGAVAIALPSIALRFTLHQTSGYSVATTASGLDETDLLLDLRDVVLGQNLVQRIATVGNHAGVEICASRP